MVNADVDNVYDAVASINEDTFPKHARNVRGNVAQLLFRAEVAARGLVPSTPAWNLTMDHVLIDYFEPHRLVRVEVKQSQQEKNGTYAVELRSSQGIGGAEGSKKGTERLHEYEKSVDVIAILLPKARCWYLIPEHIIRAKSTIRLTPGKAKSKYIVYKNAWKTLEAALHSVGHEEAETAVAELANQVPAKAPAQDATSDSSIDGEPGKKPPGA